MRLKTNLAKYSKLLTYIWILIQRNKNSWLAVRVETRQICSTGMFQCSIETVKNTGCKLEYLSCCEIRCHHRVHVPIYEETFLSMNYQKKIISGRARIG